MPKKYPSPIPPKEVWAMPPLMLTNFFSTMIVPIIPQITLESKAL
jgi:hypothetical protein